MANVPSGSSQGDNCLGCLAHAGTRDRNRRPNRKAAEQILAHVEGQPLLAGRGIASTGWPAFDSIYFGAWFAEAIDEAGLPDDCVLHGLRKCAACKLAEAGCSESEITAATGHKTTRMAEEYTKAASKKRQASAAILKLERSEK